MAVILKQGKTCKFEKSPSGNFCLKCLIFVATQGITVQTSSRGVKFPKPEGLPGSPPFFNVPTSTLEAVIREIQRRTP